MELLFKKIWCCNFSRNHDLDSNRGYGATVRQVLREVQEGGSWQVVAANVFDDYNSNQ